MLQNKKRPSAVEKKRKQWFFLRSKSGWHLMNFFSWTKLSGKKMSKKNFVLDPISSAAHSKCPFWGSLDRTSPAPYSPGATTSVENPFLFLAPEPATGMAGGDAEGGVGTAGAMGRAGSGLGKPTYTQARTKTLIHSTNKESPKGPSC